MARERQPDLILLDMLLPKIPGPEVLKALKKDAETADIPVVVFTGLSHKNAARLQHDGAFGYLEKSELCLEKGCEALLSALADLVRQLRAKTSAPQRGSTEPARSKAGVDKGGKDTSRGAFAFPQQERR